MMFGPPSSRSQNPVSAIVCAGDTPAVAVDILRLHLPEQSVQRGAKARQQAVISDHIDQPQHKAALDLDPPQAEEQRAILAEKSPVHQILLARIVEIPPLKVPQILDGMPRFAGMESSAQCVEILKMAQYALAASGKDGGILNPRHLVGITGSKAVEVIHPRAGVAQKLVERNGVRADVVAAQSAGAGELGHFGHQLQPAALGPLVGAPDRDPEVASRPRGGDKTAERRDLTRGKEAERKVQMGGMFLSILIVIGEVIRQIHQRMTGTPVGVHKGQDIGLVLR